MTSRTKPWERPSRTACMTSNTMKPAWWSASVTIPPSLRWQRSAAGGSVWVKTAIGPPNACWSPQTAAGATVRERLWKVELQRFADETSLIIEVCHYPPGTSKWNKIEHRLFCHITRNWQGVPLETLQVVINLIGSTRTQQGLEVHAWLDETAYKKGRKVTKAEMSELYIKRNSFHGDWNYEIHPRTSRRQIR